MLNPMAAKLTPIKAHEKMLSITLFGVKNTKVTYKKSSVENSKIALEYSL
jgi:hypothetical protein